jgi:hypothetical protein
MKNADDMLKEIIRTVDTSGDGKIQYEGAFCFLGDCGPAPAESIYAYLPRHRGGATRDA